MTKAVASFNFMVYVKTISHGSVSRPVDLLPKHLFGHLPGLESVVPVCSRTR